MSGIVIVLLALTVVVQEIFGLCFMADYTTLTLVGQIVWFLLEISSYGVIVCIESKLDAYRVLREKE